ncbi:hypothetical protein PS662_05114 [Pseudomonas fluorescens]|uniref:DUF3077 domain-containing protein n=1 Tax=Pseudomonas fluorescens TaxID=294 RepID=A0A5E6X0T4_PSEFL|nr:hypothetical protein [Pseudomonas fluorescens]VVN35172.1 hypothetical protein PS662_05114 [Pseudomonas fluorescens]
MRKVTPDPPKADEAPLSNADIRATPRTPCKMYSIPPNVDLHTLLSSISESLASASVILMDQADRETGPSRNTLLGIHQILAVSEISANRALDIIDPIE